MIYNNPLTIADGTPEMFFGVLAIVAVIVLLYTFIFSELTKKKIRKAKEARLIAIEGINRKKFEEARVKKNE